MIAHAAGESSPGNLSSSTFAGVLAASNEAELMQIAARLVRERVAFTPIFEPDAPYHGQLMALGLRPARKEVLKKHVSMLRLLK